MCSKPLTKSWSKVAEHNRGRPREGKKENSTGFYTELDL